MAEERNICQGCGAVRGLKSETPPSSHCDECPPWPCEDCGGMDSIEVPCKCWVSLEGMALADLKALFARDGLSVEVSSE